MYELGLEPSESLKEEYRNSEFNRRLNTFPEYEYLNSLYENGFSKEKYEFMKMIFESRPPFVYYFNPDIQLEEDFGRNKDGISGYVIGLSSKEAFVSLPKDNYEHLVHIINQASMTVPIYLELWILNGQSSMETNLN